MQGGSVQGGSVQGGSVQGGGVRGSGAARAVRADLADVFAHIKEMGRSTGVRLLSFAYGLPPEPVAEALGLPPGERTQRSVRVRLLDGAPFSWLTTHVPERIGTTYTEAELAVTPLVELLERSGVVAGRATQTISATLAGPEVAEALAVGTGGPLLSLTRVVHDSDGRGIEHLHALYRPDRFTLQMDLLRAGGQDDRHWSPLARRRADVQP